jgi:hypothetical protein
MTRSIRIKKNEENPEGADLLAKSVIQVADGFQKVLGTPLTERGIVALLHDGIGHSKITRKQIQLVIEALPRLKGWYIKK